MEEFSDIKSFIHSGSSDKLINTSILYLTIYKNDLKVERLIYKL